MKSRFVLAVLSVCFVLFLLTACGSAAMTEEEFAVAFTQYMQRFYHPIRDLSDRYIQVMGANEQLLATADLLP